MNDMVRLNDHRAEGEADAGAEAEADAAMTDTDAAAAPVAWPGNGWDIDCEGSVRGQLNTHAD
jgi:hypothetical protein